MTTAHARTLCSDTDSEPLPGTAKPGSTYVLFEWPHKWSHDVLDGDTFGDELTEKLKAHMQRYNATLLLIRHPTREGRQIEDHHVYLVFADQAATEVLHVDGPEAILDLDLSGPGQNSAKSRTKPLVLVCTHAKRDMCCAIKGRPIVNELVEKYPFGQGNDVVWETSHIKGHRFAATMLLMPWAYSFGRMNLEATEAMLEAAMRGEYFVPGNRGRGTFSPVGQVAEVDVATQLATRGDKVRYGQLEVTAERIDGPSAHVTVTDTATDTAYEVTLEQRDVDAVMASCGKDPKPGKSWVAVERS